MQNSKAKEVALGGVLFALALALSFLESIITPLLGLMPGIKLGLSNVVVMYAMFFMGARQAYTLCLLKAFFVLLTRGAVAGFLSLSGGLLSLTVMLVLCRLPVTDYILSVCGSVFHNLGQLLAASLVLKNAFTLAYAPILLISGLLMGALTARGLETILPALRRLGYNTQKTDKKSKESKKNC